MKTRAFLISLLIASSLVSLPARAENDPAAMERMDRLEKDLQLLQRQVSRGERPASEGGGVPLTNAAQVEVRLSGFEDQIRELRGMVEQNQNEVRKLAESMDRFQKDTEFRLNQTPANGMAQSAPTTQTLAAQAPAAEAPAEAKAPGALKSNFATPRDHYNYAFRLLNQTQYEQAATSFADFTQKHPKDPLVGNAFYWGGETFYIRRDYVAAADLFRQGYEAMPEGPKAADNLYKLALSLNQLDRQKEACVVLQQVAAKFKKTSTNISAKAEQEIKNSGCRNAQ
ncbi:MAG: tol-pal system protein YbgF [Rickettsiales bacterium]|nr:tol-pal system protein YbgF [Rickettsiales bacterium]